MHRRPTRPDDQAADLAVTYHSEVVPEPPTRRRVFRVLSFSVAGLGLLVLLGWVLRIPLLKSVLPGYVAMNPVTATNFVMLAAGLLLLRSHPSVAHAAGVLVAAVAALKLAELTLGWPPAVDQVLFATELTESRGAPANFMAPNTAASQLLLGLAIALMGVRVRNVPVSEVLALLAGLQGFFALVGYGYGVRGFYRLGLFVPMAVHTATALFLSTWAVLLARADHKLAALLFRASPAGAMTRRLMPTALFLPPLLGWLRLWGERRGLYTTEVGVALFAVTLTLVLLALLFITAGALEGMDAQRVRAQQLLEEVALRLTASNEELERLATTDSLTGVLNRRAWLARSEVEAGNAVRYDTPLAVLMVDADHFKSINDCHGHDAGDRALIAMAACLTAETRAGDIVGRYGGEEFCVLLSHTSVAEAVVVAERCCAAVRQLEVLSAGGRRVQLRCSIGVAELTPELRGIHQLLKAADEALFVAKRQRNCVRRAAASDVSELGA